MKEETAIFQEIFFQFEDFEISKKAFEALFTSPSRRFRSPGTPNSVTDLSPEFPHMSTFLPLHPHLQKPHQRHPFIGSTSFTFGAMTYGILLMYEFIEYKATCGFILRTISIIKLIITTVQVSEAE